MRDPDAPETSMLDSTADDRLAHAPSGHPPIPAGKIGVLLGNLGTPDGTDYWSMRRYLGEFLSDRRVIELPAWRWKPILNLFILTKRPFSSGAAYREVWNAERDEGPLLTITRSQSEKLAARLGADYGERVIVDFCMRYGNPSTASVVEKLKAQGCERIVFLPLYPQYAAATTATANDHLFRALMAMRWQPAIRTNGGYHDHPLYIQALADSVAQHLAERETEPELVIASFHGIPQRYFDNGDPYHCLCQKTSRLLRERLGWAEDKLRTTFQSRFGPEEWLKPYTVDEVARLAQSGVRDIAVIAPGFSADCLETLEEINGEIREAFEEAGGERFTYIPCLNDDDAHVAMMAAILETELAGWI